MTNKDKHTFKLGTFLKDLREKRGLSLKDVEKETGIPNAYLSQLETGARKKLPDPERLRLIADCYNVSVMELLAKAGYYEVEEIDETYAQKINKAFLHVINDPQLHTGHRIDPDKISMDVKRFVLEMYEYNVKKSSFFPMLDQAAGRVINKNILKSLSWKVEDVLRDSFKVKNKILIRYRVRVTCTETEGEIDKDKFYSEGPKTGTEKVTQTAVGEGVYEEDAAKVKGHEALLLLRATDIAVKNALPKIKGTNWASIVRPTYGETE